MNVLSRQALLCLATIVPILALPPVAVSATQGIILYADSAEAVKGSYIVVLKDSASVDGRTAALAATHGGQVRHTFRAALRGFAVTMSEPAARRLAADPAVAYVQQDSVLRTFGTQPHPPSWGLDRIDQPRLPLDQSYTFTSASNVHVYVIDSGIRVSHQTFGGRAVWGLNTTGDAINTDCHGHGTHVAGTIGGSQYGVAKDVRLVAVKVLGCQGSGTFSGVIAGIDWVTAHAVRPAVANISFGSTGSNAALETAVRASIASGVHFVVAAGNANANACEFTPARVPEAITVSASDSSDNKAAFANVGMCADLFAPGVNITSAWGSNDAASNTLSGTSTSAAHVSGAAALALSGNPSLATRDLISKFTNDFVIIGNWTPEMVTRKMLISSSTPVSLLAPDLSIWSVTEDGYVNYVNSGFVDALDFWIVLYDMGRRLESHYVSRVSGHGGDYVRFLPLLGRYTNCAKVMIDDGNSVEETDETNNLSHELQPCIK